MHRRVQCARGGRPCAALLLELAAILRRSRGQGICMRAVDLARCGEQAHEFIRPEKEFDAVDAAKPRFEVLAMPSNVSTALYREFFKANIEDPIPKDPEAVKDMPAAPDAAGGGEADNGPATDAKVAAAKERHA